MYYFDNKFLMHYLNLGVDLKVYVDNEYYDVADAYDISDPNIGYGYTIYGEPRQFDYRAIDHIMINDKTFSIDQLQSAYSKQYTETDTETKKTKDTEKSKEKEAPAEPEAEKEEETPAEPEKKEEGIQMHSYVQNIDPSHPKFMTKGSVVMIQECWITYEYYSTQTGKMATTTVKRKQVKLV